MSQHDAVGGFLARNKLTGVALAMVLEMVILGSGFSWWFRGEIAALHTTDALIQQDISSLQLRNAAAEMASGRIEERVLREIKEMRAEVNQRIDRIDDKLDRRNGS